MLLIFFLHEAPLLWITVEIWIKNNHNNKYYNSPYYNIFIYLSA